MNDFKRIFSKPSPLQVAATELAEAELELLKAESGVEYATALVTYNTTRVKRLRSFVTKQTREVAA
jgi:hypothetical protein